MPSFVHRLGLVLVALLWASACSLEGEPLAIAAPSRSQFEDRAYPVLLRDCGTPACHGDAARMFHVVGPGRARLDDDTSPLDPVTEAELDYSYDRARSMLRADDPLASRLLVKPLAVDEGGGQHGGTDAFGGDVYLRVDDPALKTLYAWARSASGPRADGGAP